MVVGAGCAPPTANQSLYRSKSAANWSPVKPTEPSLPTTCSSSTRPPSCPKPLRCVTWTCWTAPTLGKAASILLERDPHRPGVDRVGADRVPQVGDGRERAAG